MGGFIRVVGVCRLPGGLALGEPIAIVVVGESLRSRRQHPIVGIVCVIRRSAWRNLPRAIPNFVVRPTALARTRLHCQR